jgi:hypothetical protein
VIVAINVSILADDCLPVGGDDPWMALCEFGSAVNREGTIRHLFWRMDRAPKRKRRAGEGVPHQCQPKL